MSCRRRDEGSRARPRSCACRCRGTGRASTSEGLWLLRAVWMLGAGVDLQLRQLLAAEPVARQHPAHRLAEHLRRQPVELLAQRPLAEAARIAGVAVVHLVVELVPRDRDLLRVHDDDEVAGVDVGRELRLALAAQAVGDLRRESAEGLALGVDDVPVALNLARFGAVGLHTEKRRTRRPPAANGSRAIQRAGSAARAAAKTASET